MASHVLSRKQRMVLTACRAVNCLLAGLCTVIFGIILMNHSGPSPDGASRTIAFNGLPLAASGFGVFWNFFNVTVYATDTLYYLPRWVHLGGECVAILFYMTLGPLGFVYDILTYWRTGLAPRGERYLEITGIVLLSTTLIVHVAFFVASCKRRVSRKHHSMRRSSPPAYTRNAMTAFEELAWEDARSVNSLPAYSAAQSGTAAAAAAWVRQGGHEGKAGEKREASVKGEAA